MIIALYFTRKSQIEKFRSDADGIILETPPPEEDAATDEPDESVDEEPSVEFDEAESPEESWEAEESAEEELDAESDEAEASEASLAEEPEETELSSEEAAETEDFVEFNEPKVDSNEEEWSDQLTPEELDKERM